MNQNRTSTSKRSPSILVTDVRNNGPGHKLAPFVKTLKNVSVDSVLSGTSEVPSAQARGTGLRNRIPPRLSQTIPSRTSKKSQKFVLIPEDEPEESESDSVDLTAESDLTVELKSELKSPVVPLPTFQPKPEQPKLKSKSKSKHQAKIHTDLHPQQSTGSKPHGNTRLTKAEKISREARAHEYPRVTSYLLSESFRLKDTATYLRKNHRARVRLYDEALFVDYLLPLQPGDTYEARVQSSLGDNRTMERMIDISEQGDHHYEYFAAEERNTETDGSQQPQPSGSDADDFDPSEPQNFSPRRNDGFLSGHASLSSILQTQQQPEHQQQPNQPNQEEQQPEQQQPEQADSKSEVPSSGQPDPNTKTKRQQLESRTAKFLTHAAMFVFDYGVVVFWNFSEAQEKTIISDLTHNTRQLAHRLYQDTDIEVENLSFHYTEENTRPRIFNDMITLTTNSHMVKLAMSHAIAQSTKLSNFEERMQGKMRDVKSVPKTLALTGRLGMKREQVLKISGALFKLRVDVNVSSNVLDTPDFFWESEPSLGPMYQAIRQYLEIDQRILVLNEKCSVFLDLTEILADSVAEFNMDKITIIIIYLIVLSIVVTLLEVGIRFLMLRKGQ